MSHVVIIVTDESVGVQDKPDDLTVEVRDYRGSSIDPHDPHQIFNEDRPYKRYVFDNDPYEGKG